MFARAFFDAEQVFAPDALDAGEEAQVRFVVVDEVAGLVFAEAFAAPQEVEGFEQGGFAAAVVAGEVNDLSGGDVQAVVAQEQAAAFEQGEVVGFEEGQGVHGRSRLRVALPLAVCSFSARRAPLTLPSALRIAR